MKNCQKNTSNVVPPGFPVRTNAFKFVFFVFIIDFQVTLIWWFGLVVRKSGKSELCAKYMDKLLVLFVRLYFFCVCLSNLI